MKKIHDSFYISDDESLQYVWNDGLLYIEDDQEERVVLTKKDILDLEWFLKNIINK